MSVVGSTLIGGAIGAWRATAVTGPLPLAVTRFPLAKLPAAMMGGRGRWPNRLAHGHLIV
ncbi:hypothetical protein DK37_02240 [Halomonas sp. SUBG004]|nr:hypothetical protein DK37_02240 [Halomonas sp. SUBG004]